MTIENLQAERKNDSVLDKAQFAVYGEIYKRDFDFYLMALDLKKEDLIENKILDIGAGAALFAKEAKKRNIDVTALDPMYGLEDGIEILKNAGKKEHKEPVSNIDEQRKRKDWIPKALCAIGKEMPFKDASFDKEICMLSSFFYAEDDRELEDNLNESLRVLKPDGKLLIYPLLPLSVNKNMSVMNQWDINGSTDALTQEFFRILQDMKRNGAINYSIKYPKSPPDEKEFSEAGYIEIDKRPSLA
ncbi:MAG: class I SAM-dependent methyltransferase [Candidatus Moranbacteria bacterium]|nr:class I SAM-dependent methyltransferase [Candidatus Moranbacteria bacterium]